MDAVTGLCSGKIIQEARDKTMTTDNLKKINSILELKQLRFRGSAILEGQEKTEFGRIQQKIDKQRVSAERLYSYEYRTRVDIAYRDLLNRAGAKTRELKPKYFGIDRFNKHDLSRQAQRNVRLDHEQSMDRLNALEMKESRSFLNTSSKRKAYVEGFKQATQQRRGEERRQSRQRRRSPTMSD